MHVYGQELRILIIDTINLDIQFADAQQQVFKEQQEAIGLTLGMNFSEISRNEL